MNFKTAIATCAALLLTANAHAYGSHANVQILDKTQGRTLPIHWHEGKAYVVGVPGNEYEIQVRNQTDAQIMAVMSVDGVNVISGQTAAPKQGGYVFDAWQSYDIAGWRKSNSRVARFYFTSLDDSYAGRTGRPDNVGVIGVAVFRARREPEPMHERPWYQHSPAPQSSRDKSSDADRPGAAAPAAEAAAKRAMPDMAREQSRLGTGHGRNETSHVRNVDFERESNTPNEVITIYYDSYKNLLAKGVIPKRHYGSREPQPFPNGYVPDPPQWR